MTVESTSRADYAAAFEALWLTGKFLWLYANNHGTVFIDKGQAPAIQVLSGEMPLVQSWMLTRRSIELTALASFNF